jgi:trehalose synthase
MALDDPEGWRMYEAVRSAAEGDPDIRMFTNLNGVGNVEVNAFQRLASMVVQKSIREGFGLVVAEALWKGTPVVAGRAGGIPLQMADGVGGLLVDSIEGCADAIVELLLNRDRAEALGESGRERVRTQFLTPRLLLDELDLMHAVVSERPLEAAEVAQTDRDPVCGMSVTVAPPERRAVVGGRERVFCSTACRARYLHDPQFFEAQRESAKDSPR